MFLRSHQRSKDGKQHRYWSLVETVRTAEGPRQRRLCYLGELNDSAQARWLKTIEVFNQQGESQQLRLFPSEVAPPANDPNVAQVLLHKVRLERTRQLGPCYLGWELWRRLLLDEFFARWLDHDGADVAWSQVAAVLAINRLCAPGSELAIEQRWYPATALGDVLQIEDGKINDTRLYRCLDRLLPQKGALEQHLKQRYGELFGAQFDVMLYDLTSTYVEGAADNNPLMKRGYSRDHRPDCQQLVLALIVNPEGFPCSYEVFNGNRADVSTMEVILRMVERKYGKARRVWVMDRGIVSEANLAAIRQRGGQYLVGTPRSQMKKFEQQLQEESNWEQVRPQVQVKLIPIPGGQETYILCKTEGRQQKEQAIRNRFASRMEKELRNLEKQVKAGRLKNRDKIHVRIGRILASHPQVADLYQVAVTEENGQLRVQWAGKQAQQQWREAREGAYLLRTNLTAATASELWAQYMQLTEVEAAFRALKSELSIRPLFHQLERRVKAHILVAFLGYALWVTLKHLLLGQQSEWSAARALAELATLQSADIVLPTVDGREIRLRRITEPTAEQKQLLNQLGIKLPDHLQMNWQCSADFAIA
jgi:transposase